MANFVSMPWERKISVFVSACSMVCKWSLQFKSNNQKWKPIFFALRVLMQSLPLSSCFFNEQHDHGELWVDAPKANKLHLHFWLLHHWNCHHLRQPQSNQQWWWSIVAWDRCIDAMPPSSWAAQQMTTSTLPYFFCGWSTRKCTAHITECPCIG